MWDDDASPDEDEIVHAHSCPLLACGDLVSPHLHFGTNFAAFIEEDPDEIALLHANNPAGNVGSVVKDEWHGDFGRFNCVLDLKEFPPKGFALGCLLLQGSLGEGLWHDAHRCVGLKLWFFRAGAVVSERVFRALLFLIVAKRQLCGANLLLLLLPQLLRRLLGTAARIPTHISRDRRPAEGAVRRRARG